MLKDFYSVSDHFGTLCIKGLKSLSDKIKRSFFSEVDLGPLQYLKEMDGAESCSLLLQRAPSWMLQQS